MTVSDLLEQPCNKSDNINKVVPYLLTTLDKQCELTQLVDSFLADLLQDVRFLRVYKGQSRKQSYMYMIMQHDVCENRRNSIVL
jgi:hypothetical protein